MPLVATFKAMKLTSAIFRRLWEKIREPNVVPRQTTFNNGQLPGSNTQRQTTAGYVKVYDISFALWTSTNNDLICSVVTTKPTTPTLYSYFSKQGFNRQSSSPSLSTSLREERGKSNVCCFLYLVYIIDPQIRWTACDTSKVRRRRRRDRWAYLTPLWAFIHMPWIVSLSI